ncbi:MAG TPA: MarR family transcriptional regulator [Acidimicrobiia bacterium]|jgi:DNA-binding MarR family transcriptional regulator|nr:MarR family transcriptional regulator [Acidimicrobiia bacterium]
MDEPLGRQLAMTGRVVQDRFDRHLGRHGSSLAVWVVLRSAAHEEGLSQRELARRVRVEAPTLVRHLDRMERDGLVVRRRDTRDRRVVRVCLTDTGRARHAELRAVAADVDGQLRSLLTADEARTLERLLQRIRDRWHPDVGNGSEPA